MADEIKSAWLNNTADKATPILEDIFGFPLRFPLEIDSDLKPVFEGFRLKIFSSDQIFNFKEITHPIQAKHEEYDNYANIYVEKSKIFTPSMPFDMSLSDDYETDELETFFVIHSKGFRADNINRHMNELAKRFNGKIIGISKYEEALSILLYENGKKRVDELWEENTTPINLERFFNILGIKSFSVNHLSVNEFTSKLEEAMRNNNLS
jgi:hypothetical protein